MQLLQNANDYEKDESRGGRHSHKVDRRPQNTGAWITESRESMKASETISPGSWQESGLDLAPVRRGGCASSTAVYRRREFLGHMPPRDRNG
jgi:hypothetical protein